MTTHTITHSQHDKNNGWDTTFKEVDDKQQAIVPLGIKLKLSEFGSISQSHFSPQLALLPEGYRPAYHNAQTPWYYPDRMAQKNFASHLAREEPIDLGTHSRKHVGLNIASYCRNLSYFGLAGYDDAFNI